MNNDTFILVSLMLGFILGGIFVLFTATFTPGTIVNSGKTALKECEKFLPRDQHCILTAIQKEK